MNRRSFISKAAVTSLAPGVLSAANANAKRMGISTSTYGIRKRHSNKPGDHPKFADTVEMLTHSYKAFRAGGGQLGVRGWAEGNVGRRLRERCEDWGLYLEGQIGLPRDESDVGRFEAEIKEAKEAGVSIFRTVMLSGRRYENFDTLEKWNQFQEDSWNRLTLAEPVVAKHGVKLAVENHKDWRTDEMLKILERIDSEHVGVNLDTGNNISLLEDPMEVVEVLAPYSITTHLKDMGVQEYEDGFLLAEVPLGEGYLDLKRVIELCEKARPDIQFNLEMITRDPLKIPCLTEKYWVTFGDMHASELAESLRMVRTHESDKPLPRISHLSVEEQIKVEEEHNARSFQWAEKNGLR